MGNAVVVEEENNGSCHEHQTDIKAQYCFGGRRHRNQDKLHHCAMAFLDPHTQ